MNIGLNSFVCQEYSTYFTIMFDANSFLYMALTAVERLITVVHDGNNFQSMDLCKNYNAVAAKSSHKDTEGDAHQTNNCFTVSLRI
jgi:hypothetical protein